MNKHCNKCNSKYPNTLDYFRRLNRSLCKNCEKKINKERNRENRKIKKFGNKDNFLCNDCNKTYLIDKCAKYNREKYLLCINCFTKYKIKKIKDYNSQPQIRFENNLRRRFNLSLEKEKNHSVLHYCNISKEKLKKWIEFNFDKNMSWDNHGIYWETDHIKPCNSYDLTKEEQLYKCWNWRNLRPLKKEDNCSKNDKVDNKLINFYKMKSIIFDIYYINIKVQRLNGNG